MDNTELWKRKMDGIYGKRIVDLGIEWELTGNNDIGHPYFSKVVNGKVQKKQFTIHGFNTAWTEKQIAIEEENFNIRLQVWAGNPVY